VRPDSAQPLVGGQRGEWDDKKVFTLPTCTIHEHVNFGERPAYLFSFTDAPSMKPLGLHRCTWNPGGGRPSGAVAMPAISSGLGERLNGDKLSSMRR
jgi:hypothetical protein